MEISNIEFGLELEFTGLSKTKALECVREGLGGGTINNTNRMANVTLEKRKWLIVSDSSIKEEFKGSFLTSELDSSLTYSKNEIIEKIDIIKEKIHSKVFKFELVTPICTIKDIPCIQSITRALRKAGAIINETTAIHMHVGIQSIGLKTAISFLGMFHTYQDDIINAFNIHMNRLEKYCTPFETIKIPKARYFYNIMKDVERAKAENTLTQREEDEYDSLIKNELSEINEDRYCIINLKPLKTKNTIEFRGFNATLHSGKIKAYIYFILTMIAKSNKCNCFHKNVRPLRLKTIKDFISLYENVYGKNFKNIKGVGESFLHIERTFRIDRYFTK